MVSMLLRISIVRLKSPKIYIHTCDNCKSFNEIDSGGRLRQTTYSRVTASSELFCASPHSNINALAVAICFSFVFVLITLFKLRITQSIYFILLLLYKNADVKCLHNKCYGTLVHVAVQDRKSVVL